METQSKPEIPAVEVNSRTCRMIRQSIGARALSAVLACAMGALCANGAMTSVDSPGSHQTTSPSPADPAGNTSKQYGPAVTPANSETISTPQQPENCDDGPSVPEVVPDSRGTRWGHSIMVKTVLGASPPAMLSSCTEVQGWACQEVDPAVMDGFPSAIDSLPDAGGIIIVLPGIHVVTKTYKHRRPFQLLHIQGVPDNCGRRPIIRSTLTFTSKDERGRWKRPQTQPKLLIAFHQESKNLILENIEIQNFSGPCVSIANTARPGAVDQTVLVKNSFIHHCYFQAISMSKGPLQERKGRLYVIDSELGYVWSGNHLLYMAGGKTFYTRHSYYHTPGWHALKVVAHNVAVLDSVLSQVGLAGKAMPRVGAISESEHIGQGSPGSFVACQRGVFQRNKIMSLTRTAGVTRQPRKDIDGCDFEGSYYPLKSGVWPKQRQAFEYPPAPTRFWSADFWAEVKKSELSFSLPAGNTHLLPIYWWENSFVFLGEQRGRQAVSNSSTFPLTPRGHPQALAPNEWLERSRDVFLNNRLVNYEYPEGLHTYVSRADGIAERFSTQVLVDAGGNDGRPVAIPDWFVTDPQQIHPSLREPTVEDLYLTNSE